MTVLPKMRLVGETVADGEMPLPLKLAVCGLLLASSETVIEPLAAPGVVGPKVTLIVQEALELREVGQLLLCEKGPVALMLVIVRDGPDLLVRARVWAELVVPTPVLPKVRLEGESVATGCCGGGGLLLPPPQPLKAMTMTPQQTPQTGLRMKVFHW